MHDFLWSPEFSSEGGVSSVRQNRHLDALFQAYPFLREHKTRLHAEWVKIKLKKGIQKPSDMLSASFDLLDKIPKYGRVNTLKVSLSALVQELVSAGFEELPLAQDNVAPPFPASGQVLLRIFLLALLFAHHESFFRKWFQHDDMIEGLLRLPSKGVDFHRLLAVKEGRLILQVGMASHTII